MKIFFVCVLFLFACQRKAGKDEAQTDTFNRDISDLKEILALKDSSYLNKDDGSNDRISMAVWDSARLDRCHIPTVFYTDQNIYHLNNRQIFQFLYTFSDSCSSNAEYSEYSNEILFTVVQYYPASFLLFMNDAKIESNYVLSELRQPVNDGIDLESVYDAVRDVDTETAVKDSVLNSLKVAINN